MKGGLIFRGVFAIDGGNPDGAAAPSAYHEGDAFFRSADRKGHRAEEIRAIDAFRHQLQFEGRRGRRAFPAYGGHRLAPAEPQRLAAVDLPAPHTLPLSAHLNPRACLLLGRFPLPAACRRQAAQHHPFSPLHPARMHESFPN